MNDLYPTILAAAETVPADGLPVWANVCIGLLAAATPITLAVLGVLQHRTRQEARQASETAASVERKVTSNHGHDSIGDKVDELVDQVAGMRFLVERVVDVAAKQDERVKRLESVVASAAGQSADNAVLAVTSFADLNDKLDHLSVIKPPAVVLPMTGPKSGPLCRRKTHDVSCAHKRHRQP